MPDANDRDIFKKADELGVVPQDESFVEFEKRVLTALKNKRAGKLLIIAVISAIASVVSAIAAWFAVLK